MGVVCLLLIKQCLPRVHSSQQTAAACALVKLVMPAHPADVNVDVCACVICVVLLQASGFQVRMTSPWLWRHWTPWQMQRWKM
jgi:hypothetical protein